MPLQARPSATPDTSAPIHFDRMSDDAKQADAEPKYKKRVRFFLDPEKSDEEIYEAIMEMARKRGLDVPNGNEES